mgnify:CR=1 FL=1
MIGVIGTVVQVKLNSVAKEMRTCSVFQIVGVHKERGKRRS